MLSVRVRHGQTGSVRFRGLVPPPIALFSRIYVCLSLSLSPLSGAHKFREKCFFALTVRAKNNPHFDAPLQPVGYFGDRGGSNSGAVHCREAWQRRGAGGTREGY